MRRKLWKVKKLTKKAKQLSSQYNLSPILIQILFNRNINEVDFSGFLNPSINNLHSPFLLPDMEKAVTRIKRAVDNKERILIFGDYDVDGITSLAIFHEFIRDFPELFSFYIPHRTKDGYGLSTDVIRGAKNNNVDLIITFDCGTNSFDEAALASSLGIDMVIIDHHQPHKNMEGVCAFVNPKREDCDYPFSELSSGALSFKLLQALKGDNCHSVLDLVALSVVCDVSPIKGENRVLLNEGLKVLKDSTRTPIKALCDISRIKQQNIDTFHIGYILGPRINASGRVAHAEEALKMFLTDDREEADRIANKLQSYNKLRRDIEYKILKEAESRVDELGDNHAIVVHGEQWHKGVLGIVASRLADKYYRPSFVISFEEGDRGVGSARSIHSIDLAQVLGSCSDHLHEYGGHKRAAGIQIFKEELDSFREKINSLIKESSSPEDFVPVADIDLKIDFKDIDNLLVDEIEKLKPFGEGNPEPMFVSRSICVKGQPKRITGGHVLWLTDGERTFEGMVYDKDILEIINFGQDFDIVYSLSKNTYHNQPRLIIRDCRLASGKG